MFSRPPEQAAVLIVLKSVPKVFQILRGYLSKSAFCSTLPALGSAAARTYCQLTGLAWARSRLSAWPCDYIGATCLQIQFHTRLLAATRTHTDSHVSVPPLTLLYHYSETTHSCACSTSVLSCLDERTACIYIISSDVFAFS